MYRIVMLTSHQFPYVVLEEISIGNTVCSIWRRVI